MENIKVISNLTEERNASSVSYTTKEAIEEHKEQCDYLLDMLYAKEQNLLLKLECKPNDIIWVYSFPDKKYFECIVEKIEISFLRSEPIYHIMVLENCLRDIVRQVDFGKTVFLTKEEAEQALAEMKGE